MRRKGSLLVFSLAIAILFASASPGIPEDGSYSGVALDHLQKSYPGVKMYHESDRIVRIYGKPMGFGFNPEASAEQFCREYSRVFGVESEELEPVSLLTDGRHTQPVMYIRETGEYKFTLVYYSQYEGGLPVYRADLRMLVKNEPDYPLVLAISALRDLGDFTVPANVTVNSILAENSAKTFSSSLRNFSEPRLVVWAGIDDMDVTPAVVMEIIADNGLRHSLDEYEKWLFLVDAQTGEILYHENMILNIDVTGNVSGMGTQNYAADICDFETSMPLPYARASIQGGNFAYADINGDFIISNSGSSPVTVISQIRGEWFLVNNEAGGNAQLDTTITPPGPVNFLHNALNTEEFYRAQVNGYIQANVVRDFTLTYNPAYPGLQQNEFPVNVNLANTCNAFYDYSSINFYRSGGGCPNTAYGTIVHHEYGHHLVYMAGSGQGQYGEGMGDVMGVLITDDPGLAYGFFSNCNVPLRNADNNIQYPCTGPIHDCGQLISGCVWDTRNALIVNYPNTYIDIIANLAVNAMLLHTGDMITPAITIDYLTLDDDNGNIYDGTPHYPEICEGFNAHSMDCPELQLIGFQYPNELPELIDPDGGTTVRVEVYSITQDPQPGTGMLHYDDGSGWVEIAMQEITPNIYDAVFPAVECGLEVLYYLSAETQDGQIVTDPYQAPASTYSAISAISLIVEFEDNFETHQGWTVENIDLVDGAWERAIPAGGGDRGDPPTDYDGSGNCYVTDNEDGNSDVDGGPTRLISPTFSISADAAFISYARWFYNDDHDADRMDVHISNDDGSNWVLVESVPHVNGWVYRTFGVADYVTPTNSMKMRFSATDNPNNSVTEAGIDAFRVVVPECQPPADVVISMVPWSTPVIVPQGGSFHYVGTIENTTEDYQTVDVWVMLGLPGGGTYGPLMQFNNITLSPNQIITVNNVTQQIPGFAPLGTYDYISNVGDYPGNIWDSDQFEFIVIQGLGESLDWNLNGWFDEKVNTLPTTTELFGSYPNPFNAATTFSYALAEKADVTLEVYNLLGQKVVTLLNENQAAGYRSVQWDASEYASGVYFYKLSVGEKIFSKRLTLLK